MYHGEIYISFVGLKNTYKSFFVLNVRFPVLVVRKFLSVNNTCNPKILLALTVLDVKVDL